MPRQGNLSRGADLANRIRRGQREAERAAHPCARQLPILHGVTRWCEFRQPQENVLAAGREILTESQRVFTYDYGPPSFTLEAWRYESTFWFEDDEQEAPARRCSTRLSVSFEMVIEGWDYGCETITVRREQWPAEQDRPNIIRLPRQDVGNR